MLFPARAGDIKAGTDKKTKIKRTVFLTTGVLFYLTGPTSPAGGGGGGGGGGGPPGEIIIAAGGGSVVYI